MLELNYSYDAYQSFRLVFESLLSRFCIVYQLCMGNFGLVAVVLLCVAYTYASGL
jgi:hypothetical protein